MLKKIPDKYIPVSIEHESILRKFTVLFLLMSIIPMGILQYFYVQISETGTLQITVKDFNLTMIFVVLGVVVGYFAMRVVLGQLIDLTNANKKALEDVLSPEKIRELSYEKNEIAVLAQSFEAITTELEESVKNLNLAKKALHSIMDRVSKGISNMENIDTFLELILETVTNAMSGKVGVLILAEKDGKHLWVKTVYGVKYDENKVIRFTEEEEKAFHAIGESKESRMFDHLSAEIALLKKYKVLFSAPMACAPMVNRDKIYGFITVSGRDNGDFEENERNLLLNLASQTAVAIENSRLNRDMEKTYFETISALALAVNAKDKYSWGHLDRVAYYGVQIAKRMGLDDDEIKTLRDAARLHDLGKIGIPDNVLGKRGKLTDQEWEMMKKHPEIGESIIKPIHSLSHLCDIVRHHHEKLDGSGYPDGLRGDEISPLVRITTAADIYDALTSDRPYRDRFTREKAFEMLREMKDNGLLDPDVVEILIEAQGGA
ncbi:MAG TPA: HD domain-containing protein [Candidatus Omnitrophota bacterium]|nr:HD domain-containing protein [Candidatus Omnitrophota bacterium]